MALLQELDITLLLVLLLSTGLALFRLKAKLSKPITYHLAFYSLLVATIIGFLFWLDNNQDSGCLIEEMPVLSSINIIYSGISIALLCVAYTTKQKKLQLVLFGSEFLFWLIKLMILKGGYAVGYSGIPYTNVLVFDSIAITLRFILITQVAQFQIKSFLLLFALLVVLFILKIEIY